MDLAPGDKVVLGGVGRYGSFELSGADKQSVSDLLQEMDLEVKELPSDLMEGPVLSSGENSF